MILKKFSIFFLVLMSLLSCTGSIHAMENNQPKKTFYASFVNKIIPSCLKTIPTWIRNNQKKVLFGSLAAGYFTCTPGGRELLFGTLKESKKATEALVYKPEELLNIPWITKPF